MKRLTLISLLFGSMLLMACNPFSSGGEEPSAVSVTESSKDDVQYVLTGQMPQGQGSVTTESIDVANERILVIEFIQASVGSSDRVSGMGLFAVLNGKTIFIDNLTDIVRDTSLEPPDYFGTSVNTNILVGSGESIAFAIHRSPIDRAAAEVTLIVSGRLIRAAK